MQIPTFLSTLFNVLAVLNFTADWLEWYCHIQLNKQTWLAANTHIITVSTAIAVSEVIAVPQSEFWSRAVDIVH